MTARPTDWSPLCAGDPVPGDWEEVQSLGKNIRAVADEIKAQSDKLRNLCTDGYWESDAGEKFDETAKDTATALSKAYARYDAAADALEYYYPKLKAEQEESLLVLADAQALESDRKSAQDRLDADDEAPDDPEAPERPGRADDQSTVGAYFGKLNALRDKVEACATAVRKAANNAADHIESVIDDDGLKDSRLDKMRNWVHEHVAPIAKVVAEWAGKIAAVFGLLALAVGWIPIIGQALAAVFGTIALVAGVISLVANLALWFSGDGGFGAVLLDMVGVLTFGVGRAAIAGLKGGVAALNATGKLATAATKIGAQVTARGGQMSTAVVNAIAKSDLRLASQLSHIPLSSLKGMVGGKLGGLAVDFGAGGFRHLDDVIKGAPQGLGKIPFPHLGDYNPATVGREFLDGGKDLFKGQNWTDMWTNLRSGNVFPGTLEHDMAEQLANVRNLTNNIDYSAVADMQKLVSQQLLSFNIPTGIGAFTDYNSNWAPPFMDGDPILEPIKPLGTWEPY